jgi:hypothetical protein
MTTNAVAEHRPQEITQSRNDSAAPETMNPARMIALAIEKGAGLDQLEKLMDLHERWEANEARKAFVRSMASFKSARPTIYKNKDVGYNSKKAEGGSVSYSHATLDNIDEILGEHLSRVGISYTWRTKNLEQNWVAVTCILTHELGHSQETTLRGPADVSGNKNPIQMIASTITYLERYTLLAATGTSVRGMDDDGQASAPNPRVQAAAQQRKESAPGNQSQESGFVNEGQRKSLQSAIEKAGTTTEQFCRAAGIDSLAGLKSERFKGAMMNLGAKAKKQEQQQ